MPITDDEKVLLDLTWKMYNEHATQARQHETLRASIATSIITLALAVAGLYQYTKASPTGSGVTIDVRFVSWSLIILGLIGFVVTYKHYERNRMHVKVLSQLGAEIDRILMLNGMQALRAINSNARHAHERRYFLSHRIRLHWLWGTVFLLIIIAGIYFDDPIRFGTWRRMLSGI